MLLIIILIISILLSMTLHEAVHGYVAYALGDETAKWSGRLSLNPLRHIDPVTTVLLPIVLYLTVGIPYGAAKPVPVNSSRLRYGDFGMALVGIAGPLTNLMLALIGGVVFRLTGGADQILLDILKTFILVNISFFTFNMIPYPPLDGSRLLYAFAPEPVQDFMRSIENMGIAGLLAFMLVFYMVGPNFLEPLIKGLYHLVTGSMLTF